ncbi:Gfo/Idh/MocA family protein [Stieleria varia]|uniref:4-carboxy-2-hydroxymuconate-6-semialdehyde dehydrogenase n=1 Tax=Stieleria varia TaxID=2528005 RepID=A0A5C6ATJ7_9BACT|nr:Gfo/Idh/MocA family oxidoreductase [Stieleria varia]TWU02777.1 4-carboxy-2-hydroxymuconate-6-semialdehyde dehydrogenase [Stieleria varia]
MPKSEPSDEPSVKSPSGASSTRPLTQSASRRGFIKGGSLMLAGGALGNALAVAQNAHAFGSDEIRVALVGCGRRGTQSAIAALGKSAQQSTSGGRVVLIAMADVFANQLQSAYRTIKGQCGDHVDLDDRRFVGLDAYQQVMQTDADVVLLATPPAFRPLHFAAAVDARKHVLMEKPVANDAAGVREVLAAGQLATQRNLACSVGFTHRQDPIYQQVIAKIHDGAIGDPVFARAYCNAGPIRLSPRRRGETELEYQLRNWNHFPWLGGDFLVEQHVSGLDIINWALSATPRTAQGQGGWMSRDERMEGQVFDHHSVEFAYSPSLRLLSQCRRSVGCWNSVSEHLHGTAGYADLTTGRLFRSDGDVLWKADDGGQKVDPTERHQASFFAALRRGERPNEIEQGAQSTLTAIMGRVATVTGKLVRWDDLAKSTDRELDVTTLTSMLQSPPCQPDEQGHYPDKSPVSRGTSSGRRPV